MAAVRRIVVGVHGSLGSLQALRYATEEARARKVPLVPVIAWVPPGGEMAERRTPSPYLRRVWEDAATKRLVTAFEAGLGGVPDDVEIEPCVERGETGPVLVDIADQPGDLLVIGTGRRSLVGRAAQVGRPLLPRPRQVPGARGPAVGADGRDEARPPAVVAAWAARARVGHLGADRQLTGSRPTAAYSAV